MNPAACRLRPFPAGRLLPPVAPPSNAPAPNPCACLNPAGAPRASECAATHACPCLVCTAPDPDRSAGPAAGGRHLSARRLLALHGRRAGTPRPRPRLPGAHLPSGSLDMQAKRGGGQAGGWPGADSWRCTTATAQIHNQIVPASGAPHAGPAPAPATHSRALATLHTLPTTHTHSSPGPRPGGGPPGEQYDRRQPRLRRMATQELEPRSIRVLVVDSDAQSREATLGLLAECGYKVRGAPGAPARPPARPRLTP